VSGAQALREEVQKNEFLPRVLLSGKRFKKNEISSPSVALGEE
jgi:hypothetical protein